MSVTKVLGEPTPDTPLFLTCEHADNQLPDAFDTPLSPTEQLWLEEHWGWDLGAEAVVRALVELEGANAVLSRYTRLLCDVNRAPHQKNLVRTHVLGEPIPFNQGLSRADVRRRVEQYHVPYHDTIDRRLGRQVEANADTVLMSVHTFTPVLDGDIRPMEIGILFNEDQPYAANIADHFRASDFDVALNKPYSGMEGLIYSARRHGVDQGIRHFELEIRNDLVDTPEKARSVAERIADSLHRIPWYG